MTKHIIALITLCSLCLTTAAQSLNPHVGQIRKAYEQFLKTTQNDTSVFRLRPMAANDHHSGTEFEAIYTMESTNQEDMKSAEVGIEGLLKSMRESMAEASPVIYHRSENGMFPFKTLRVRMQAGEQKANVFNVSLCPENVIMENFTDDNDTVHVFLLTWRCTPMQKSTASDGTASQIYYLQGKYVEIQGRPVTERPLYTLEDPTKNAMRSILSESDQRVSYEMLRNKVHYIREQYEDGDESMRDALALALHNLCQKYDGTLSQEQYNRIFNDIDAISKRVPEGPQRQFVLLNLATLTEKTKLSKGQDDQGMDMSQLPLSAQSMLRQYFPTAKSIKRTHSGNQTEYTVKLEDGGRVELDAEGNWTDINCQRKAVPTQLIPPTINEIVAKRWPQAHIVQIERDRRGYEIELSNGLEVEFNNQFEIKDIDD